MPIFLTNEMDFPAVEMAAEDGLLAIGGDLNPQRLIQAYQKGIFPWYNNGEPVMWWCPDPRFVLFPKELKISKSMKQLLKKNIFEFKFNTCFEAVIRACQTIHRAGQPGTWITEEMVEAYIHLHKLGYAHSAEAWVEGKLVGGLYGIKMGKVFFGESMFSKQSNASKFAFIYWIQKLQKEGIALIDCQVYTPHLESLGARMIPRKGFTALLQQNI